MARPSRATWPARTASPAQDALRASPRPIREDNTKKTTKTPAKRNPQLILIIIYCHVTIPLAPGSERPEQSLEVIRPGLAGASFFAAVVASTAWPPPG